MSRARFSFSNFWQLIKYLELSWWRLLVILVLSVSIISLSINVYSEIVSAVNSYRVLQDESQKLELLREDYQRLQEELDYYSSLEYKQRYAYESLNLAREGEQIYVIENLDDYIPEQITPELVVETEQDNNYWWQWLFGDIFSE